ncbi:MAG: hypothetical protein NC416_17180 [Eubacterium sp.]|nr:hypothetical protein [Eubacterium sp.]
MKLRKKGILIPTILLFATLSCGFSLKKTVTLNTESRILYQNCSVDQLLSDIGKNFDVAKDKYDDGYYIIVGKIAEIADNNKEVVLGGDKGNSQGTITCSVDQSMIAGYRNSDIVKVYGEVKISGSQNKPKIKMDLVKIEKADGYAAVDTKYSYIEGGTYDTAVMQEQKLHGGKVKYYVPKEWGAVEYNIVPDLGDMEGYQYVLNALPDKPAVEPESLFVCYFDSKNKLSDRDQVNETKAIRKLIVTNILGANDLKETKRKTYYGTEYYYYVGTYKDKQEETHRVEFVFQDIKNEGMVVYLYVYEQEEHVNDIMCVMRCLTVL